MTDSSPSADRLSAMPLWRLLVLLEDVEREVGPSCPTARLISRLVAERLRAERRDGPERPAGRKEVANG
jgi:hypothetical protein